MLSAGHLVLFVLDERCVALWADEVGVSVFVRLKVVDVEPLVALRAVDSLQVDLNALLDDDLGCGLNISDCVAYVFTSSTIYTG